MDESVAPSGKLQLFAEGNGQNIWNGVLKILQRGVNGAANHARAECAYGFIDGNDAASFCRIDFGGADDFDMRIDHLAARRAQFIDFHFAVKNELLAWFEAAFEIAAVKEFTR